MHISFTAAVISETFISLFFSSLFILCILNSGSFYPQFNIIFCVFVDKHIYFPVLCLFITIQIL